MALWILDGENPYTANINTYIVPVHTGNMRLHPYIQQLTFKWPWVDRSLAHIEKDTYESVRALSGGSRPANQRSTIVELAWLWPCLDATGNIQLYNAIRHLNDISRRMFHLMINRLRWAEVDMPAEEYEAFSTVGLILPPSPGDEELDIVDEVVMPTIAAEPQGCDVVVFTNPIFTGKETIDVN